MNPLPVENRSVPKSVWFELQDVTLEAVLAVALLATTASLFLLSSGLEETAVPLALVTVGVILLGFALVRLFAYLRVEGVPIIE